MTVPMTVSGDDAAPMLPRASELHPGADEPGLPTLSGLLVGLQELERQPLAIQAERLEAVRKGLDEALARPDAARSVAVGGG